MLVKYPKAKSLIVDESGHCYIDSDVVARKKELSESKRKFEVIIGDVEAKPKKEN